LLDAVNRAFKERVRVNWNLAIQTNSRRPVTFPHLASILEQTLDGGRLIERSEELEDVLRRLFYDSAQVSIERLLWQLGDQLALAVFGFDQHDKGKPLLVTVTRKRPGSDGIWNAPALPRLPDNTGAVFVKSAETIHYLVCAYSLNGADLETILSLSELYRAGGEKTLLSILDTLLQNTLVCWHDDGSNLEENKTLGDLYRDLIKKDEDRPSRADFDERVQSLARQIRMILGLRIDIDSEDLTIHLGTDPVAYPNPVPVFFHACGPTGPVRVTRSPGYLSGENILVDRGGRVWLTDFTDAGSAPELWDYISLEAVIRFDSVESNKLESLYEMELNLNAPGFAKVDAAEVEPGLRKAVRAIQVIRRYAAPLVGTEPEAYNLGILAQAFRRIVEFDAGVQHTPNQLVRLGHCLIAGAMISEDLADNEETGNMAASQHKGVFIEGHDVWVDGAKVRLRGQLYKILHYLYEHANEPCSRRDLVERVLKLKYDETDPSQISRLNTAMRRLRERIEVDPQNPRYVITEPGVGYLLARPQ
jgi:hypothetical protein